MTTPILKQLPPLAADIAGMAASLAALAHRLTPEDWAYVSLVRRNILIAADRVAALENNLGVPRD